MPKELELSMAETSSQDVFQGITENKIPLMQFQELKKVVLKEWREKDTSPSWSYNHTEG